MPELPDVIVYVECLRARIVGQPLVRVRLASPFVLRSVTPTLGDVEDRTVRTVRRLGKRIVIGLEHDLWLVIHLMIAGRLRWRTPDTPIPKRRGLAAFDFPTGTVLFTEEGTKKRASLHVVGSAAALRTHDPGGRYTAATVNPVRSVRHRCSASSTLGTRRTTVHAARRTVGYWPTAACPGCSRATGHVHWRSWS